MMVMPTSSSVYFLLSAVLIQATSYQAPNRALHYFLYHHVTMCDKSDGLLYV